MPTLSRLHHEMIRGLIERGACPSTTELAEAMGMTASGVQTLLRALSDIHGVVLHPHVPEPWIIHPFSLTPTINWVEGKRGGWWAPCVWCALGVAALVGGEVRVHTRYAGEADPLTITVVDGCPAGLDDIRVHFAIPPAKAWENVHQHCSLVLPFRSEVEIVAWCGRHRLPRGQAVPLPQVASLARSWYGSHADADWHKWTIEEAQDIFHQSGLRSAFWDLGGVRSGNF